MLNTKYKSSNPFSFKKNFEVGFLSSYDPTCDQLLTPMVGLVLTLRASYKQTWKRSKGDAKHQISKVYAFQFREEEF